MARIRIGASFSIEFKNNSTTEEEDEESEERDAEVDSQTREEPVKERDLKSDG